MYPISLFGAIRLVYTVGRAFKHGWELGKAETVVNNVTPEQLDAYEKYWKRVERNDSK